MELLKTGKTDDDKKDKKDVRLGMCEASAV
jgi:hypothetical protein